MATDAVPVDSPVLRIWIISWCFLAVAPWQYVNGQDSSNVTPTSGHPTHVFYANESSVASPIVVNIATMFECPFRVYNTCTDIFKTHLFKAYNYEPSNISTTTMNINVISLPPPSSAVGSILVAKDAAMYENISLFVVVGKQDMINLQHVVTATTGIPLVAYATDKEKNSFKVCYIIGALVTQSEIQLAPSRT